ncbi:sensor histidine kinase [Pigmentiphaga sp. H8]|uniref:sensor histidine kinase n=1 Tax=Pigmentiphaga sp. H8 TaxID=2488560 RepID=UPI000F59D1F0|nr:sensor histidine kinase [Pigmentiphaga sp. H8]AZG11450.1 sensor histidine kinase [Pigmentiphaga sp. H8]
MSPPDDASTLHELRLRELHHRMRNGLHLLSSALQVQARRSGNEDVRREFGVAVSRIESLVRLHDHAYRQEPGVVPDASAYLADLAQHLQSALIDPRSNRLVAITSSDELPLDSDAAMSLGSVLIELATNAVKYSAGNVHLDVEYGPGLVTVTVEDEGVGFPPEFELPADAGFGLRLVGRICEQHGGTLAIDRSVAFGRIIAVIGLGR